MTFAAFDTLKAVETLREAGVEEAHAKAIATTMRDAVTEGVATKADLRAAVADLKADLQTAVTDLKADIRAVVTDLKADTRTTVAELKADLLKAVIGIVVAVSLANVGLTFAVVRLLGGGGGQ